MAKKNNLKSVRLSDQVMDYVINFEGDGFNQKFENLVLFCMEQEETKKQKIAFLDQQIVKQYKKLDALQQISSRPLTDWTQPVQRIRQEGWEACRVSILLDYPHVLLS